LAGRLFINVKHGRQREDLSQIRTENGPHMMATLRELAMSITRLTGVKNIARKPATSLPAPTKRFANSTSESSLQFLQDRK
jgi:hypothetical protein